MSNYDSPNFCYSHVTFVCSNQHVATTTPSSSSRLQSYKPYYSPRRATGTAPSTSRSAHPSPPYLHAHSALTTPRPRSSRVSCHFCAAARLALYRTFELVAAAITEVYAYIASLAASQHLATFVKSFHLPARTRPVLPPCPATGAALYVRPHNTRTPHIRCGSPSSGATHDSSGQAPPYVL
jgi:hypothetical protein